MKLPYPNLQKESYTAYCPVVDTAPTLCIGSSGLYERQECYEDIDMHGYLKRRYWGRNFRTKGYCVSTVAFDQEQIESYVRHQLQTDKTFLVCVECRNLPAQWILDNVLPQLENIETSCTATNSAGDVLGAIQNATRELRELANQCKVSPNSTVVNPDALSRLAARPELGPGREGLFRILYHIDREVGRLRPGAAKGKARGSALLRLPICPDTVLEDALLWSSFLLDKFGISTSILTLVPPVDNKWIDLIVGEPTESHLYCLLASTKVIPLTSSIPYNINSEFVKRANRLIYGHNPPKCDQ